MRRLLQVSVVSAPLPRRVAVVLVVLTLALSIGPSAAPASRATAPRVGIVGDSITWQSEAAVRNQVGRTHRLSHFNAFIGATIGAQRLATAAAVRAARGPDILLIELGTNDAGRGHSLTRFARDVRRMLDSVVPHVDAVVWFDLKPRGHPFYGAYNRNARAFNRKLRHVVSQYRTVVVGHYSAWSEAAGPRSFDSDRVHLSRQGEREYGRLARQAADGFDPALTTGPFWDITDDYWAAPAIRRCAAARLAGGYANGTYRARIASLRPEVTRGQWLRMLWRVAGSPAGYPPAPWSDVPSWLDGAARWAAASGVARGTRFGTLRPNGAPPRVEAVRTLYRLAGSPPAGTLPAHGLTGVPARAESAVRWAVATAVLAGYPDGTFRADDAVTRTQAAVLVDRYMTRVPLPGTAMPSPTEGTAPPVAVAPTTLAPPTTTVAPTAPPTVPPTTPPSSPSTPPTTGPAAGGSDVGVE